MFIVLLTQSMLFYHNDPVRSYELPLLATLLTAPPLCLLIISAFYALMLKGRDKTLKKRLNEDILFVENIYVQQHPSKEIYNVKGLPMQVEKARSIIEHWTSVQYGSLQDLIEYRETL